MEETLTFRNSWLPRNYLLDLNVDPERANFSGILKFALTKNFSASPPTGLDLVLHAHRLVITKAELEQGNSSTPLTVKYDRKNQLVHISDDSVDVLQDSLVKLTYLGSVTTIKTFRDETYGLFRTNYSDAVSNSSNNHIWATHFQPFGARSVFPVIDELALKLPISLTLTTRSKFKVASNAAIDSKEDIDLSENAVFAFKPTPPIAPSVFGFVLGDMEEICAAKVRVLTTKGDSKYGQYALDVAARLFLHFENVLGDYPLDKLDIVALPFLSDSVMENWGLITVMRDILLVNPAVSSHEHKLQVRQLISHQLTHQWIGNFVTLDSWQNVWLIEAFATWFGNYIMSLAGVEPADTNNYKADKMQLLEHYLDLDSDCKTPMLSIHEQVSSRTITSTSRTNTIFDKTSYEKGMILLDMIGGQFNDLHGFTLALKDFIEQQKFQTVKAMDLWKHIDGFCNFDVLLFVQSWSRYRGYPLLKVLDKGGKIYIEQNRFLANEDVTATAEENHPYHVPLAIDVLTDKGDLAVVKLILTDRSLELPIPVEHFICLNSDRHFYYRTVYGAEFEPQISKSIAANILDSNTLMGLIEDTGKMLGQPLPQSHQDLFGANQLNMLIAICQAVVSDSWVLEFEVLKRLVSYVEVVNSIMLHFSPYKQFKRWYGTFSQKLFHKLGSWEKITSLGSDDYEQPEYEVRNVVLQMNAGSKEAREVCKRLYRNFFNSGLSKKFTPKELLTSMFNVTLGNGSMAEYKQVLALAKNAQVSYLKHTNASAEELQTAAISSLGFASKPELLSKTLHFVHTNIDSKLIELALIGTEFSDDHLVKESVWRWYELNYDHWAKLSLRKGSQWAEIVANAMKNVDKLVLGRLKHEHAESFVNLKLKTLPPHGLAEVWREIQDDNHQRKRIGTYFE